MDGKSFKSHNLSIVCPTAKRKLRLKKLFIRKPWYNLIIRYCEFRLQTIFRVELNNFKCLDFSLFSSESLVSQGNFLTFSNHANFKNDFSQRSSAMSTSAFIFWFLFECFNSKQLICILRQFCKSKCWCDVIISVDVSIAEAHKLCM